MTSLLQLLELALFTYSSWIRIFSAPNLESSCYSFVTLNLGLAVADGVSWLLPIGSDRSSSVKMNRIRNPRAEPTGQEVPKSAIPGVSWVVGFLCFY